jgi:hypothetical protein
MMPDDRLPECLKYVTRFRIATNVRIQVCFYITPFLMHLKFGNNADFILVHLSTLNFIFSETFGIPSVYFYSCMLKLCILSTGTLLTACLVFYESYVQLSSTFVCSCNFHYHLKWLVFIYLLFHDRKQITCHQQ